jgi:hypothetical protein
MKSTFKKDIVNDDFFAITQALKEKANKAFA